MDSEPFVTLVLFPLPCGDCMYSSTDKGKEDKKREEHDVNSCQEPEVGGLSLDLSLGFNDSTCTSKKRKRMENPSSARGVSSYRNKRTKVDREEARMLELTELRLGNDPYCIKKTLTGSDLGNMSRLMLAAEYIESYVFPFWNADQLANIKEGLAVSVWDCDTQTEHELVFKQWNKRANVLIKNWVKDFVKRRELKLGDEIGLYWDTCNSRFQFSVLNRFLVSLFSCVPELEACGLLHISCTAQPVSCPGCSLAFSRRSRFAVMGCLTANPPL
ncbi:hypothetical protein QQP08_001862 [Theobroma cacao]|nr:hypothetical protein QQP08_001862 [Theobroma cacao]